MIEISEVRVMPIKSDGSTLVAFGSCVIGRAYYAAGIAIHYHPSDQSFQLVFPVKKFQNGTQMPLFHPVTKEAGNAIHKAIVTAYENFIKREFF